MNIAKSSVSTDLSSNTFFVFREFPSRRFRSEIRRLHNLRGTFDVKKEKGNESALDLKIKQMKAEAAAAIESQVQFDKFRRVQITKQKKAVRDKDSKHLPGPQVKKKNIKAVV